MKFALEIEIGNDAMLEPFDIAEALRQVAAKLDLHTLQGAADSPYTIRDLNGNMVGKWEVTQL